MADPSSQAATWMKLARANCEWFLPTDLSGRLVEPSADSSLPVFVEMGVQDHSIPAGGHGCLPLCNTAWQVHTGIPTLHARLTDMLTSVNASWSKTT